MLHLRSMKWPVGGELELGPANEQVTRPVLALFSLFFFKPHSHGYMPTLFLCMSSVAGRDRGYSFRNTAATFCSLSTFTLSHGLVRTEFLQSTENLLLPSRRVHC